MKPKREDNAGCFTQRHRKSVGHYVDYDYIDQLDPSTAAWLGQFSDEYYGARFVANKEAIHPQDMRKDIYSANNARNRDVMSARRKSMVYIEDETAKKNKN